VNAIPVMNSMTFHHVTVDVVTVENAPLTAPTFDVVPLRYTVNTTNKGHKKMMTRKDYVAVADLLNRYALSIDENTFDILIHDFAGLMAQDNERFIADRFISACWNGVEND